MKQFQKILKFELKGFFKNKMFVGFTLFIMAAIAVVMFIPNIMDIFQGESENEEATKEDLPKMCIYAEDVSLSTLVKQYFELAFTDYQVVIADGSVEDIKTQINDGEIECAFAMESLTSYTYYVENLSMHDANTAMADEILMDVYRTTTMLESGMTEAQIAEMHAVKITSEITTLGKDQFKSFLYAYVMIFALYMVMLLYGQMVATNVATEKSSRAMELLITSAKPASMMFGKVIAACIAGFVQLVAVFGTALVFYNINQSAWEDNEIIESIFSIPLSLFGYLLVFFILGFLIYAFLYGAMGSTVSKLEDVNTAVMPITMMFVVGFMIVMFSMTDGNIDSTLMVVCSYIPFTSPMAMFTRICMSTVAWYEITASILLLAGTTVGIGFLAAKIYRVGVLLYGTTPKIGSVMKAVFKS